MKEDFIVKEAKEAYKVASTKSPLKEQAKAPHQLIKRLKRREKKKTIPVKKMVELCLNWCMANFTVEILIPMTYYLCRWVKLHWEMLL